MEQNRHCGTDKEEVEHPKDPNAPTMYKYTMFIESDGTSHKQRIQQDTDKVMEPMDLDFSFEDVDLVWHFKSYTDALTKLAAGKKTPLKRLESTGSQASGSQASGTHEPLHVQKAKEQLAIEDANEKDKLC